MAQGDSGHAQATMVTEQYTHILDYRKQNTNKLEDACYKQKPVNVTPTAIVDTNPVIEPKEDTDDKMALVMKLLSDPQTADLLKILASKM